MVSMMKSAGNPQAMLSQIASQNPKMQQIINMVGNGNPQTMFYDACKQRGVDPNSILNMLR